MEDKEIDDIYDYLLLHGHNTEDSIYNLDDEMLHAIQDIAMLDFPTQEGTDIYYINKELLLRNSKTFFDSYFKLHNVGLLTNKKLNSLLNNKKINSIDRIIEMYNNSARFVSPYEIPIKFSDKNLFAGTLVPQVLITENREYYEKILPKLNLYFVNIELSKYITEIGTSCYIHEITHSQLESNKGIVKEYYNAELLSIFFELLYQLHNNNSNYSVILANRIKCMIINFNNMYLYQIGENSNNYGIYNYFMDSKYLISILKSFNLLNLYLNSSDSKKKEIITKIQQVFDGNRHLEEVLDDINVNLDNSLDSNITKNLIKI